MKNFKTLTATAVLFTVATCVTISPSLAADKAATLKPGVKMPWNETGFKKPSDTELKKKLTPLQYDVTQHEGTEAPYQNTYWDNHADGIYVDAVSGEPLFSSKDKSDSGTGWPSFSKPLEAKNVTTKTDSSLFTERTEVRSRLGNSHLGHVFDDGPKPTGLRYCMNSASMRFIAAADLEKEGYGQYASLFAPAAKPAAKTATPTPKKP